MNHLHFIDYFIILLVLSITLWLGFRFAKRQKTTENYFLSKGNFPAWAVKVAGTIDVWVSFPKSFSYEEVLQEIKKRNFDKIGRAHV